MSVLPRAAARRVLRKCCRTYRARLDEDTASEWPWRITFPEQRPIKLRFVVEGDGFKIHVDQRGLEGMTSHVELGRLSIDIARAVARELVRFEDFASLCAFLEQMHGGQPIGNHKVVVPLGDEFVFITDVTRVGDEPWAMVFDVVGGVEDIDCSLCLDLNRRLVLAHVFRDGDYLKVGYRFPICETSAGQLMDLMEGLLDARDFVVEEALDSLSTGEH